MKLASCPWLVFDNKKNRWEKFKACTMNMAKHAGHCEDDVLPGNVVVYLDHLHVGEMNLDLTSRPHLPALPTQRIDSGGTKG